MRGDSCLAPDQAHAARPLVDSAHRRRWKWQQSTKPSAVRCSRRSIPLVEVDEAAARRTLRDQIAKLEAELSAAFVAAYPRTGIEFRVSGRGGPRMLSLGDLERLRDDLAHRVQEARRTLDDRAEVEGRNRLLIEEMLLEPGRYKWVRIANVDIGEPGCRHWHVRPRLGPRRHADGLVAGQDLLRLSVSHRGAPARLR